jgi:hypothetical protein
LASLPSPCRRGVSIVGVGRPRPESLPLALGINEEWACPFSSQAANLGVSKLRKRRSYQRLTEPFFARWRSSFFFPEAKTPNRKIFRSCHDARPSGLSPAPASSLWRSKSTVRSVRSGADLGGPNGFFPFFSCVPSIKFQCLFRKPWVCRGFVVICIHRLVIKCSF